MAPPPDSTETLKAPSGAQPVVVAPAPLPTTKDCPQCAMPIPLAAKRCGHCTTQLA